MFISNTEFRMYVCRYSTHLLQLDFVLKSTLLMRRFYTLYWNFHKKLKNLTLSYAVFFVITIVASLHSILLVIFIVITV